jgi:uncharacterized protein (DUF169 family)
MSLESYRRLAGDLTDLLKLKSPPLAITFSATPPAGVAAYEAAVPAPTQDGRTGKVPAGCVFWTNATERTFSTAPADHGNCSVGSLTHGLKTLAEAAQGADVAALVQSGWVSEAVFPHIPTVAERPGAITYGPLRETPVEPDVVFLRLTGIQVMMLHDAVPDLRFEGKPQCHIIPIAKEQGQIAVSVGCMLSRVRTEMANTEMTCAIPAARLPSVVEALRGAVGADDAVARYAAEDARRFAG